MVRRRKQDRSLFEVLLPDSDKLWPEWLKRIDTLLEDEAVIDTVTSALEQRWPKSRTRGREGTPAEVVLRMLILKHLHDWSYDELEQEVRANLVYRAFTRIGVDAVPDAKTILKIANALGPEVITDLHQRVVDVAKRAGVTRGRRFRLDTTVVETDVHYPTDSTLLQDGVRAATRTMQRARHALGDKTPAVRDRARSVARRCVAIRLQSRSPKTRPALVRSYRRLLTITRTVQREAGAMIRRIGQRLRGVTGRAAQTLRTAQRRLQQLRPIVDRVMAQTRTRLLQQDTHVPDKVLSIFEPHTEAIRKGKAGKPTEFGKLVTIQEAEHQIVTAFEVHGQRPADATLWAPALDRHQQIFGRAPHLATGDKGFSSAANERAAEQRGVRRIVLPARGHKSAARRQHERQRWFRRGQRWRTGCEGRISVLKRRHGLRRCRYHGHEGIHRWVGFGVIADNLINVATYLERRAAA
jgi:IS5 family transposase